MLFSNIVGAELEALRANAPVELVFEDVTKDFTLPKFRLVD